jgi:hypothetical protein
MRKILTIAFAVFIGQTMQAQISGSVFRDFDLNKTRTTVSPSSIEPLIGRVIVNVYNSSNALVASYTTTTGTGAYPFTGPNFTIPTTGASYTGVQGSNTGFVANGTAVRLEFLPASGDYATIGTTVQFVTGPSATVALGLNTLAEKNATNPRYVFPLAAGMFAASTDATSLVSGLYTDNDLVAERVDGNLSQTGSIWGLAYQKLTKRMFASAMLKRPLPLGAQGLGGLYMFDYNNAATAPSAPTGYNLEGVVSTNTPTTTINFGSVTRVTTPNTNNNYISGNLAVASRDNDAFAKIGKVGYGDIEFDETQKNLWAINLNQRTLLKIDVSTGTPNLTTVQSYDIIGATGMPSYSAAFGELRPWALKFYKGRGYIGLVGDASVSQNAANLMAYVVSFDPTNLAAGYTSEFNFSLAYAREKVECAGLSGLDDGCSAINSNSALIPERTDARWKPWANTWAQLGFTAFPTSGRKSHQQPILSGIDFMDDGSMVIGLSNRYANQMSIAQYTAETNSTNTAVGGQNNGGDILKATKVTLGWVLEQGENDPASDNTRSTDGIFGGGEFFWGDYFFNPLTPNSVLHAENANGAVAVLPGSSEVLSTAFDPKNVPAAVNNGAFAMGTERFNINTGAKVDGWIVEQTSSPVPNNGIGFGKGNSMGDVEFITDMPAIEIGNRVWLDANGNGIQDADETTPGVPAGTLVILRSPGPDGDYTTTADNQSWNATTNANGNYLFSALSTPDSRTPASWIGVVNTILPGFDYRIEIVTPTGLQVTKNDASANGVDNIDNDAVTNGTRAIINFNTNTTNHSFDFGFKNLASIGDKVYLDNGNGGGTGNDGIQNGTEPGVAGVTVTLYRNGTDGIPGTADDDVVGTTVTDAFGDYLFDNLTPSTSAATSYNVGFTLPANHQFTTQTNTQVTGTSNATNTTTLSNGATALNGSDANVITGRSGSFWLDPLENERGVDAGLVLKTPVLLNSIGDRVWLDNNNDGLQTTGEPGVAGITVTLYNTSGAVVATTVTDANGNYIFTGLPAGTDFRVGFTLPAGMIFTTKDETAGGGTDDTDSDVNLSGVNFGKTDLVNTGAAGNQVTNVDAGIKPQPIGTASLGDRVWNDLNGDGTQDAGEQGIAGVTVNLYEDTNGDGILAGAELTAVATTVTDAFGKYTFNGLVVTPTNRWQVGFVQPSGYSNTAVANNNSGNDATDSDIIDDATDRTGFIRLKADERNANVDAGFVLTSSPGNLKLGDKAWKDTNGDGLQDAGEPGVPGVTVQLYTNGPDGFPGTADDVLQATTTTDINGDYLFTNLAASTVASTYYNVRFSNIPNGYSFTKQLAGPVTTDSDVNASGNTSSIILTADDLTIDAGIKPGVSSGLASIGNRVWYDLNDNGLQDAGELGVAGVTVTLKDGNGNDIDSDASTPGVQLTVTVTNALGEYIFTGLPAGSYQVQFSNMPTGYVISDQNSGSNDDIDSDGSNAGTTISATTTSTAGSYVLGVGAENLTVDLGLVPPANTNTLGGTVWFDTDSDGSQTGNNGFVKGVTVTLYNSAGVAVATTSTDENGDYLFVGLPDGDYSVGFSNYPPGFDLTSKSSTNNATGSDADRASGTTNLVKLDATNRNDRSLDAGLVATRAALGNRVWDDLNGDGIQNAGEPGVSGIQVILYAADGTTVITSTITDAKGNYLFSNLNAGTYVVGVNPSTIPAGMQFTTQDNTTGGEGDGNNTWPGLGDSDVSATTGKTAQIVLAANSINLTVDAGIRSEPTATVGNRVWDDLDADGVQDPGEPGIPGVIATLYNSANVAIGSAVTADNGTWLITNVPPGSGYYVVFTNKPFGAWTAQDNDGGAGTGGTGDTDTDSDVDAGGQTGTFTVLAGDNNIKIDAGVIMTVALPVNLVSFTAVPENSNVKLQWKVANELNINKYTVEFSADATNFTTIENVAANNVTGYAALHTSPVKGVNYYRLKVVEANGNYYYSAIRKVNFADNGAITVYPIPAKNTVSITLPTTLTGKTITATIVNAKGAVVATQQIATASQTEAIDVSNLASGMYYIRIVSGKQVTVKQIQIIK